MNEVDVKPTELPMYGSAASTYKAIGELAGITQLVDCFYSIMDSLPEAKDLRAMHSDDLTLAKKKLVYFLSGWMGGPKLYAEHFGSLTLPVAHSHFPINMESKNSWLLCMEKALEQLDYPDSLQQYLMEKFATPAESILLLAESKK